MKRFILLVVFMMSMLPAFSDKYEKRYSEIDGLDPFLKAYFNRQNDGSYIKKTDKPLILVINFGDAGASKRFVWFVNKYLNEFGLDDVECVVVKEPDCEGHAAVMKALMPSLERTDMYPVMAGWTRNNEYVGSRVGVLMRFFTKKDDSKGLTRDNLKFSDDSARQFFEILWDAAGY